MLSGSPAHRASVGGKPAVFCLGAVDPYFSRRSSGVLSSSERRASASGILGSQKAVQPDFSTIGPRHQHDPSPQPQQTCLTTGGPGWSEVPASAGFPGHIGLSLVLSYCPFLTGCGFHLLLCAGRLPLSLVVLHLETVKDSCPRQGALYKPLSTPEPEVSGKGHHLLSPLRLL